jgi:hypothetical protein
VGALRDISETLEHANQASEALLRLPQAETTSPWRSHCGVCAGLRRSPPAQCSDSPPRRAMAAPRVDAVLLTSRRLKPRTPTGRSTWPSRACGGREQASPRDLPRSPGRLDSASCGPKRRGAAAPSDCRPTAPARETRRAPRSWNGFKCALARPL